MEDGWVHPKEREERLLQAGHVQSELDRCNNQLSLLVVARTLLLPGRPAAVI